jgi:predicted glycosyltransferase
MKVMIVVTHLLGTGHLARATVLGRAFAARGHAVTLVSGGRPVPHIDTAQVHVVQLPPLASDGVNFSRLLDRDGNLANAAIFDQRRKALQDTLHRTAPDALITELFPFGRRNLSDEFLHLLETAKALPRPPKVFCSIRDILAPPSKPAKADMTQDRITAHYDAVLVHSDPDMIPLNVSWPVADRLEPHLLYTGFVAPPPALPHPDGLGQDEIIVSAGGGDVGRPIFDAAVEAARQTPSQRWRILVGGAQAAELSASLSQRAGDNTIIEPARPEFRSMLHHAKASVSMCGYNTAMDVLQAGVPAVWVPFDAGGEVEQGMRAKALSHLPGMDVIETSALTGARLNTALSQVTQDPPRHVDQSIFKGAEATVQAVADMVGGGR